MTDNTINNVFAGKIVATRGIGSGVNVGKCAYIDGTNVLLVRGSFFLREWQYTNAHGPFHSLSSADVTGGTITKTIHDSVVTDTAQVVICDPKIMDLCEKFHK